jgi:hypothetical protein
MQIIVDENREGGSEMSFTGKTSRIKHSCWIERTKHALDGRFHKPMLTAK